MTRIASFGMILIAALTGFEQHASAQTMVEYSAETRFQLDLHVPDAVLMSFLPSGWTPNVATQGPAKDANLRAVFIDRITINGPDGKPVGKGSNRLAYLVAPVKDSTGAGVQLVIGGLTEDPSDAPGPFGNYLLATTHKVQRSTSSESAATLESQDWSLAAATGEHLEMHIKFERGSGNKGNAADTKFYSAKNPSFVQISRQEQVLDILRNVTTNPPDRVKEFSFKAGGGSFSKLFDGTQKVLSWDNILWLNRSVLVPLSQQAQTTQPPQFKVDPFWPKPLPQVKDAKGQMHQWITGEIGGNCVDSRDHVFVLNRGWQQSGLGKLQPFEGMTGIAAPPVLEIDADGNLVNSWGDASLLAPGGGTKVMPESLHGCFVDYEDNVWIAGNSDGVVQKYSHDGKLLMQIGTKGVCDGPPTLSPKAFFPTCGSPGDNMSKTLLNDPADIAVDSNPDPVTNQRGSVYIADGYGNHRIVVFDNKGKYLRQWGSAGDGPGQFAAEGGGHPHCVMIGTDNLIYVCDRAHNRVQVFDKTGAFKRFIPVDPPGFTDAPIRVNDIGFSTDPLQTFFYSTDVGSGNVWIVNRMTGVIVGGLGTIGHHAGGFVGPHTLSVDSKGNIYIGEGGGGRRIQKFVKQ